MPRGRSLKTPCRKRTKRNCKIAKKSCTYASGSQRSFCRKRKNRTHKNHK